VTSPETPTRSDRAQAMRLLVRALASDEPLTAAALRQDLQIMASLIRLVVLDMSDADVTYHPLREELLLKLQENRELFRAAHRAALSGE
jgi:hypothetical protein